MRRPRQDVDPAERQADDLGRRIGSDLGGLGSVGHGPLPASVQSVAESHLGVSLAGTQIDAGSSGQRKADDESALAVTEGKHIAFNSGELDTATTEGRALLGHELVHVGQQARHAAVGQRRTRQRQDKDKPPDVRKPVGLPADPKAVTLEFVRDLVNAGKLGEAIYVIRGRSMSQMLDWLAELAPELEGSGGIAALKSAASGAGGPRLRMAVLLVYSPAEITPEDWLAFRRMNPAARQVLTDYAKAKGLKLPSAEATRWADAKNSLSDMELRASAPLGLDSAATTLAGAKADLNTAMKLPAELGALRADLVKACATFYRRAQVYQARDREIEKWARDHRVTDAQGRVKRCAAPMRKGADIKELDLSKPARHALTGETGTRLDVIKRQECCAAQAYVAAEGACTIGYGHVVKTRCKPIDTVGVPLLCEGADPRNQCGAKTLCDCDPPLTYTEATADRQVRGHFQAAVRMLQQSVPLDLTDDQLFALADLMVHGIPLSAPSTSRAARELLDLAYDNLCVDDEVVREKYKKTGTGTTGAPEVTHAPRREARVWAPRPAGTYGPPKATPDISEVVPEDRVEAKHKAFEALEAAIPAKKSAITAAANKADEELREEFASR